MDAESPFVVELRMARIKCIAMRDDADCPESFQSVLDDMVADIEKILAPPAELSPETRAYWNNVRQTEYFEPPKETL